MNTNALFVYSRDARLAGSGPHKKRKDLKLLLSPFAGRSKNERRVLRRVGKPEVGQIGTGKSASVYRWSKLPEGGVTAIAAQQLFGSGVKLRPGQTVEYVFTNSESSVPNDRVRAFALWEGWFGYDRKKYAAMLRDAFEPFVLCIPKTPEIVLLNDDLSEEELKRFPLFAALVPSRP